MKLHLRIPRIIKFLLWSYVFFNSYNCQRETENVFSGKTNKVVHLDKFLVDCPDMASKYGQLAIHYINVSYVITKSGFLLINYRLRVNKNLPDTMILKLIIKRCASREAPDTCIRLTTFSTSKVCALFLSKNDAWSTMVNCMKPNLICPIHKGDYIGTNCTLNMQQFNLFPFGNSYWKIRAELYTKDKVMLACQVDEGIVKTVI